MDATSSLPSPGNALAALRSSLPEPLARALVTGAELRDRPSRRELLPTAVAPFDRLLHGGLPRGALVEVVAPRSAGRFSLGIAALAAATRAGEAAALVDVGDHLDPQAAAAEGVDLRRLLWVRPCAGVAGGRTSRRRPLSPAKQALAAAETLLAAGFPLVVLDLGLRVPRGARQPAAWVRLSRAALVHDAALLVLSPARITGGAAQAVLSARSLRSDAPFGVRISSPPLLEGLTVRLTLEKRPGERPGASEAWRLRTKESLAAGPSAVRPAARAFPSALPAPARRAARG